MLKDGPKFALQSFWEWFKEVKLRFILKKDETKVYTQENGIMQQQLTFQLLVPIRGSPA
jgi:hypothetical protein